MRLTFCTLCGSTADLHHHHLKPRSEGGSDDEDNLLTLCHYHHGVFHECMFRPQAELSAKGIRSRKEQGKRLGPKNKRITLSFLQINKELIPNNILPALLFYSYGYFIDDVVKIKWEDIEKINLNEEYKVWLDTHYPIENRNPSEYLFHGVHTKAKCSVNAFNVTLNRILKQFGETVKEYPIASADDLKQIRIVFPIEEYVPKDVKKFKELEDKVIVDIEIIREDEEYEYYKRTEVLGDSLIPESFILRSHFSDIKLSQWVQCNKDIPLESKMIVYLISLGFTFKDIQGFSWLDIKNSHLPSVVKREAKRIMDWSSSLETEKIFRAKHSNEPKTVNNLNTTYFRLKEKHFPEHKIRRKTNGVKLKKISP